MIDVRISYVKDDDGREWLDEVACNAGAYLEATSDDTWFLSMENIDGSRVAIWITGRVTMLEEWPSEAQP